MNSILSYLQQIAKADRAPITAAIVGGLVTLLAHFGFRLNGSVTGYIAAGVGLALGLFVQAHFSAAQPSAAQHAALVDQYKRVLDKHEASLSAPAALAPSPEVVEEVQDTFPHPVS